jgi:aspartyl-tRNA(Asn)/glutamyl-tRNA(Gln) amidotransferase subunit A
VAEEGKPAERDAPVVRRLRASGAIIVAKTNMTEFAFSGVGMNPHYGTPGNPADRARIPGGSTSGGAVAVADGMCEIAIGSDTGGSTRIPGALCGLVGFKPSRQRISIAGVFPLAASIDSVGPIARSVADCAKTDAVMAGDDFAALEPAPLAGLRIGIAQGAPLENLDEAVAKRFPQAIDRLEKAGCRLSNEKLAPLEGQARVNGRGGVQPVEAFALHRDRLDRRGADIDPNVRGRLERARSIGAADYIDMVNERAVLIAAMDARLADIDVLALPTTPIVAPTIAEMTAPDVFARKNAMLLRNTSIANFFDLCAISLPLPREGGLPTGLMLFVRNGHDRRLFRIAAAIERLLAG